MISANRLSIYGAATEFCNDAPKDFRAPVKLAALDRLEKMEIPTDLSVAENSSNAQQWRNSLLEYERKFEQVSEDQKSSKLCSDAGLKLVETGKYFFTLETEERQQMQHFCQEYTMPRNEKGTRVRGWIRMDTRIGPVLKIKGCYRDDRYSIEVQIPSLFQDHTVDKYVPESMLAAKEEDIASGKPIAKARPRQKLTVTLTSVSIHVTGRKWIDLETQRSHDHKCHEVSKAITR